MPALEGDESASWDSCYKCTGVRLRRNAVVASGADQCRCHDVCKAFPTIMSTARIELLALTRSGRSCAHLCCGKPRVPELVDLARVGSPPGAGASIVVELELEFEARALLISVEFVGWVRAATTATCRRGREYESVHAIGPLRCQVLSNHASERDTDDMTSFYSHGIEQTLGIASEVECGPSAFGGRRLPKSALVVRDHAERLDERAVEYVRTVGERAPGSAEV